MFSQEAFTMKTFRSGLLASVSTLLLGFAAAAQSAPGDTELVSQRLSGQTTAFEESNEPVMSANGAYVAFSSFAPDLVSGDTTQIRDVFVRNMQTGAIERVSVSSSTTPGNA